MHIVKLHVMSYKSTEYFRPVTFSFIDISYKFKLSELNQRTKETKIVHEHFFDSSSYLYLGTVILIVIPRLPSSKGGIINTTPS